MWEPLLIAEEESTLQPKYNHCLKFPFPTIRMWTLNSFYILLRKAKIIKDLGGFKNEYGGIL